jgi:hypothetical protein
MTESQGPVFLGVYEAWCQACADLMRAQWAVLDSQYRLGLRALGTLLGGPEEGPVKGPEKAEELEGRARERMRRGLPPPREVYDAQNRGRIDWSQCPDWARPSDPEMFQGAHEG